MRRLFMQDSESPRTLRQLALLVGLILAALLLSDWLLGRILPYLTTEPPFILRPVNVAGVEALWRANEAGIQPVVFTGSSQVYTGVSPHAFDERLKAVSGQDVQAVNVSILGSMVAIERDLIRHLIMPNQPRVVIYGIEMRAIRAETEDDQFSPLIDFKGQALGYSVSQATGIEQNALMWLLRNSSLVRYRDNIRQWLTGIVNIESRSITVDDVGFAPFPNEFLPNETIFKLQFVPFSVDAAAQKLFSDIRMDCQQSGVTCILLNMPLHNMAYAYITGEEETQYQQVIQAVGLPIWDFNTEACRNIFGDDGFYNLNHLNSYGAEVFTDMIADVFANVFYDVPVEGDAACATVMP